MQLLGLSTFPTETVLNSGNLPCSYCISIVCEPRDLELIICSPKCRMKSNTSLTTRNPQQVCSDAMAADQEMAAAVRLLHIRAHLSTANLFETSFQTFIKPLLCRQIEPKAQETSGAIERGCRSRKASAVSSRPGRRA